jgi:hypothetical protein
MVLAAQYRLRSIAKRRKMRREDDRRDFPTSRLIPNNEASAPLSDVV